MTETSIGLCYLNLRIAVIDVEPKNKNAKKRVLWEKIVKICNKKRC